MARIYQRAGKKGVYWYLDYAVEGWRLRKRVGRSKRLADVQVKLERKELGFATKDRPLPAFVEEYPRYAEANKAKKSYERDVLTLKYFTGFIESDKLSGVTATKLEAYKAVAWGALAENPARTVKKFRESRRQVRYLSK